MFQETSVINPVKIIIQNYNMYYVIKTNLPNLYETPELSQWTLGWPHHEGRHLLLINVKSKFLQSVKWLYPRI